MKREDVSKIIPNITPEQLDWINESGLYNIILRSSKGRSSGECSSGLRPFYDFSAAELDKQEKILRIFTFLTQIRRIFGATGRT